ncbi:Ig-like domain-containing protein [Acetanaerobacterium elongatum]|uniref:Ig-like domain (Group 2) n=1 Tax=Acetanaerobacterium elongatum TaxID=258515 RepID=A0A1H0BND4_9FIRM|nr:Ig-like domain-containing protein [Acetanaerobacterium elongatum]SDN47072.1 Ig-like domain (group 2) [Acetanaerobacterium elongatum]
MYDVLESQFSDTLNREGKTVTIYNGNAPVTLPCLFRKNSDRNKTSDKRTIYYPIDAGIQQGKLIQYNNDYYISINQETSENHVYYHSDLEKVNSVINVVTETGYELFVKCHAYDWQSVSLISSALATTIDGTIELITEDNEQSRKLAVNNVFVALGATWQIFSIYYKSGICYIFVKRTANSSTQTTYSLDASGNVSYKVDDTATFTTLAKINDTTIVNPTILWETSDTSKATISNQGVLTCISAGTVTITAKWVEHNITAVKEVVIDEVTPPIQYTASITYSGDPVLKIGQASKTFTAAFKDINNQPVTLTPVWSLDLSTAQTGYVLTTSQADNYIKLKMDATSPSSLIGTSFKLNLRDSNSLCSTSLTISIMSLG